MLKPITCPACNGSGHTITDTQAPCSLCQGNQTLPQSALEDAHRVLTAIADQMADHGQYSAHCTELREAAASLKDFAEAEALPSGRWRHTPILFDHVALPVNPTDDLLLYFIGDSGTMSEAAQNHERLIATLQTSDGARTEIGALEDRVAELEQALRDSQDWNWLTAKEEAEEAGRDTFEIEEMQALADLANHSTTPLRAPAEKPPKDTEQTE